MGWRQMMGRLLGLALMMIAAPDALATANTVPIVEVEGGRLSGIAAPDAPVNAYLGVPFAAPPTGKLRWREPQPVLAWEGARAADHFGPSCFQPELTGSGPWTREFYVRPPFSEDCLYLNIWTPARHPGERLPVVVWLPGGGFFQGGANEEIYYGGRFAAQGIVFVSPNYRVGLFGFFGHPELAKESPSGASGNYALLDEIAALRWVQRNIAGFGGDPARVTVDGQSAGAQSIAILLSSPLATGLFHQAIAQSGLSLESTSRVVTQAELQDRGSRWVASHGGKDLAGLRALPPEDLLQPRDAPIQFGPAVDGLVLTATPSDAIKAGKIADIPVLTGFNAAEGAVPLDQRSTPTAFAAQADKLYGQDARGILQFYPASDDDQASTAVKQLGHNRTMAAAYAWAETRGRFARSPLFFYEFTHTMPGPTAGRWGAFHSSEIAYAFGTLDALDRPFTKDDRRISDRMMAYCANFIRTGNPNGPGLPEWPAFAADGKVMALGGAWQPHMLAPAPLLSLLTQGLLQRPN